MNPPIDAATSMRAPRAAAQFARRVDELPAIVAFTRRTCAAHAVPAALLPPIDLAVEELFTNMVKYGAGSRAPIRIEIAAAENGVEVTLIDADVEPFDITRTPDADVTLPLAQRSPGGLGLHLTRRLVDSLTYRYEPQRREAHVTFRKTLATTPPAGGCR